MGIFAILAVQINSCMITQFYYFFIKRVNHQNHHHSRLSNIVFNQLVRYSIMLYSQKMKNTSVQRSFSCLKLLKNFCTATKPTILVSPFRRHFICAHVAISLFISHKHHSFSCLEQFAHLFGANSLAGLCLPLDRYAVSHLLHEENTELKQHKTHGLTFNHRKHKLRLPLS